jgi:hypothetical protein
MRIASNVARVCTALLLVATSSVQAQQTLTWQNYCAIGGLHTCASVGLTLTPTTGGTEFSIRARNLEGTLGNTPWAMFNVTFKNLETDADFNAVPMRQGTLTGTADFEVSWSQSQCVGVFGTTCPTPFWGQGEWDVFTDNGRGLTEWTIDASPNPYAVIGCDAVSQSGSPSPAAGYFRTCGAGAVEFNFTLPGEWEFDDQSYLQIAKWTDASSVDTCVFGTTCQQVTTTPEPATLTLIATGLVGAGLARRRRQRRGANGDVR